MKHDIVRFFDTHIDLSAILDIGAVEIGSPGQFITFEINYILRDHPRRFTFPISGIIEHLGDASQTTRNQDKYASELLQKQVDRLVAAWIAYKETASPIDRSAAPEITSDVTTEVI